MIGRLLVAVGLAMTSLVIFGQPAHACSCMQMSTARHVAGATHVFVGTVTGTGVEPGQRVVHDIDVQEVYKGEVPEVAQLHSNAGSKSCGLGQLPADRPIVFFATSTDGALVSHSCSGTAPASDELSSDLSTALGDPAVLNETGTPPPHAETSSGIGDDSRGDGTPVWPWVTALLAVAVGAGAWTARRTT